MIAVSFAFALNFYVPVNNPVYDFLERQAVRGFIPEFKNDVKPLTRNDISAWLMRVKEIEGQLHQVDKQLLKMYISDYRHELTEESHPALGKTKTSRLGIANWNNFENDMTNWALQSIMEEDQHIFIHEDENKTIWVNTDISIRGEGKNVSYRSFDKLGAEIAMQFGDNLAFYTDSYFYHQLINDEFEKPAEELINYPYYERNYFNTLWNSKSYASLSGEFGKLSLAYYPVVWGNSLNSILLSEVAPPFSSISYTKEFKKLKYQFLYGSIMSNEYTMTDAGKTYLPKYIVGHHMEIHLHPKFHVNIAEMMIYGNRPLELTYMVPFLVLWPTETVLGLRDNKMISVGGELFVFDALKFIGNMLIDDLWLDKLGQNYYKQRVALQGGFQWSPRYFPMDLKVEYTAVRPWTYAHHYPASSFTHNGSDLGFKFGPNSQVIDGRINYDISARHRLSFTYQHIIKGADSLAISGETYPTGSNSNQNYCDRAQNLDYNTTWLMGDLTITDALRLEWLYRWRNQIEFLTTAQLQIRDGQAAMYYGFQVNLRY